MQLLKLKSRGDDVKKLQKALNLYPDGIYGKLTVEAVMAFQRENGLNADGVVGPKTWEKIVTKSCHSTQEPAKNLILPLKKSVRYINEIIVHCTATEEGKDVTVKQIKEWHTLPKSKGGRGWSDIGYHYVIYRDGSINIGRDVNVSGAHCTNHNSHSVGVCYVGGTEKGNVNKPKDTRTPAQKEALLKILTDLKKLYPQARIFGHRNFANKACPSFDAKKEYANL